MTTLEFSLPMLVSAIILAVTFAGIFTEELHGFHRSKFAVAGAVAMIIIGQAFGFYTPAQALEMVDANVILLLATMMTIVAIMAPTGGFQMLAYLLARISGGRKYLLLVLLGLSTAVISMFLDNVTTVVIFGPLTVLICQVLGVRPLPYLLTISLLAVIGGIATVIGDPTSIMIGSAAGTSFLSYAERMVWVVGILIAVILGMIWLEFREDFRGKPATNHFEVRGHIRDAWTWYSAVGILVLMIALFVMHHHFGWQPWMVGLVGMALLSLLAHTVDLNKTFESVEITLLMFLTSLFIVIGGVEASGFLEYLAQLMVPFMQHDLLLATLALLWAAAILSAVIDNIPFVAAMIPIIIGLESQGINANPLWWALALGAGIGGLGSHVGSAVNVFIVSLSERLAKQTGDHSLAITPLIWLRRATPAAGVALVVATVIIYTFFDFFAAPFERVSPHIAPVAEAATSQQ